MDNYKKSYIIRTSKNTFYYFFIKNECLLTQVYYNDKLQGRAKIAEMVQYYSVDIDERDVIHIACLSNHKLLYLTYPNNFNHQVTVYSENGDSFIKELSIKVVNCSVHLFYQLNKTFFNRSFIYHSYFYDNHWHHIQLKEVICPKYVKPFLVDYNKDELFMFHCNNFTSNEYEIIKFSFNTRAWTTFDKNIIFDSISNLNFFITPAGVALLTFNKIQDKNLQVFMMSKNIDSAEQTWSSNINISINNTNCLRPTSFFKNGFIYIVWLQGDTILYKKSSNLKNWSEEYLDIPPSSFSPLCYLSNHKEDEGYKTNNDYMSLFNSEEFENSYKFIHKYILPSLDSSNLAEHSMNAMECASDFNYYHYSTKVINTNVNKNAVNETSVLKSLQKENSELYNMLMEYRKIISNLKYEKENLRFDSNKKIQDLLKIIEDKNSIINVLLKLSKDTHNS
jgi:hypothetical protein